MLIGRRISYYAMSKSHAGILGAYKTSKADRATSVVLMNIVVILGYPVIRSRNE